MLISLADHGGVVLIIGTGTDLSFTQLDKGQLDKLKELLR